MKDCSSRFNHPYAKIAGYTLMAVGGTTKLILAFVDGTEMQQTLTAEQAEKAKKNGVAVEFNDGKKQTLGKNQTKGAEPAN